MSKNSGFTLIEILVTLVLASIVMSAIFLSYKVQVASKTGEETTLDMAQSARAGLEMIASDIQMAGLNPTALADANFVTANSDEVEFTMDFAGRGDTAKVNMPDGQTDSPGEDIRYSLSGGDLMRERVGTDAAGGVALINHVDALDFVYLDQDGAILNVPNNAVPNAVPAARLADIRAVEVSFVVHSEPRGMLRVYTDKTQYENQQGIPILPSPNDTRRRLQLSTTVQCRNMGVTITRY